MSEKARRQDEEVKRQDDPEVEAARKDEEERGGYKELHEAVQRIREAVAARKPPKPEDIELAQRYLGNARVAALLQGLDPEQEREKKVDDDASETPGRFRLAVYVRKAETRGAFDPGQCVIGLQGPEGERLYGFHPGQGLGPAQYRHGGVNGEILTDRSQLEGARMTSEVEITREQLEVIRAHAEALRAKPPSFEFDKWNSINFVAEVLGAAGVDVPDGTFLGMATPQSLKGDGAEGAEAEVDMEDDADGDGDGDGDGEGEEEEEPMNPGDGPPPDENKDKKRDQKGDKKKPGFFGRLFSGDKGDKGGDEGGGGSPGGEGGGGGE